MTEPLVQLVDEHDQPLGGATKADIFENALLHRIVRIMLFDEDGLVLVQKRQPTKSLYPGCWDNSAAGHVDEGEDYLAAANRELLEELGIEVELAEARYYRAYSEDRDRKLDRFTKIFTARIPHDTALTLQPEEVSEVKWMAVDELVNFARTHHDQVTDGLQQACERLFVDSESNAQR